MEKKYRFIFLMIMNKYKKRQIKPGNMLNPSPVVMVSCGQSLDEYNIVLNNSSLTSSLSLNKKVVYSSDTTLLFDKIDIYRNPLDNNRNIENDVKSILSQNYLTYRNRRGLGAYGFLVNYIDNSDKPYVTLQIPLIDDSVYFSGMYELNY